MAISLCTSTPLHQNTLVCFSPHEKTPQNLKTSITFISSPFWGSAIWTGLSWEVLLLDLSRFAGMVQSAGRFSEAWWSLVMSHAYLAYGGVPQG